MRFPTSLLVYICVLQASVYAVQTYRQARSPYVELILCSADDKPFECARQQTSRLLNLWSNNLKFQLQDLKGAADKELNASLISRGFSSIENFKEKPSTIITKLEIGSNFLTKFMKETADEFMGRSSSDDESKITENDDNEKNPSVHDESLVDSSQFNIDDSEDNKETVHDLNQKHGFKKPINYGRSNGVSRGKKKKKKALMKLVFLGTLLKGKIELLLKILSAHLQVKFFAIALIGLIINIARFWVDLRRGGGMPQKVIYYEHAHHQHHYEDQGNEDWNDQGGSVGPIGSGGYWKRSLPINNSNGSGGVGVDSFAAAAATTAITTKQQQQQQQQGTSYDSTYATQQYDPQYQAYRQQIPSYF